jgi:hypothetical protein
MGGELAERVKDLYPRLPVALIAASDDPHADDLLEGYADLPFLQKPVALGPGPGDVNFTSPLRHEAGPLPALARPPTWLRGPAMRWQLRG